MILILQTVFPEIQLVLCDESGTEKAALSWISDKDEVSKLLPAVEEMLGDEGYKSLNKIVVVNGIGAFSSTRIGVTIANTLAMTTGADLYSIKLDEAVDKAKLIELALVEIAGGGMKKIVEPIYKSTPMISESKKKKFT